MDLSPFIAPGVTALITAGATYAAVASRLAVNETKIDSLTEEVRKHNHLVERMTRAETREETLESAVADLRRNVEELNKRLGGGDTT